jgi:hypothetical protein
VYACGDWPVIWRRNPGQESQEGLGLNGWAVDIWAGETENLPEGWAQIKCIWAGIFKLALNAVA